MNWSKLPNKTKQQFHELRSLYNDYRKYIYIYDQTKENKINRSKQKGKVVPFDKAKTLQWVQNVSLGEQQPMPAARGTYRGVQVQTPI